jgi:hypothetical protein
MPFMKERLTLLTFPQSWDGAALAVRFLCLPKTNPQDPLGPGLPDFASANIVLSARLIAGFEHLPLTAASTEVGPLTITAPPVNKTALFEELTEQFTIAPSVAPVMPPPELRLRKVMTDSYRELVGTGRRPSYLSEASEYECALHEAAGEQPPDPVVLPISLTWGRVIAFALRQPRLAEALGLMGGTSVTLPDPAFFEEGGWLFLDLHATSDYAGVADFAARYAARIPPLTGGRRIFAAVLFPVADGAATFVADDAFREAEMYDDGLAKQVHGTQTSARGDAIQLAWDDEQLTEWLQRQVRRTPAGELAVDAPNGVAGYRVDVRRAGEEDWSSLVKIESPGDLMLGAHSLGRFTGEGVVEAVPAQLSPKRTGLFWLPSYFTEWRGSSLALMDQDLASLHSRPELQHPGAQPYLLNREKVFRPVGDRDVPLRYGRTYEFRVRLADLTRGGPDVEATVPEPPGSSVATIAFKRRSQPGPIAILERPEPGARHVKIAKPRLGYPDALFTGRATFADIEDDVDEIAADPSLTREPSVPDPDVLSVAVRVEVKALSGDAAEYFVLYETSREMAADELTVPLDFQDHFTLDGFSGNQPDNGPLALPTTRDLRVTLTAIGRDDEGYFFDETARRGVPVRLDVRADADVEAALLTDAPAPSTVLQSFFFQHPPADNSVAPPAERLAGEIHLDHSGLTLSGRAGHRTVLGCSAALRHTLSPERSSITFASAADLLLRWVNVVHFRLERDWTWDGLDERGMDVVRVIHRPGQPDAEELAGTIKLPHAVAAKSLKEVAPDLRAPARQFADLMFFDAVDPKPRSGEFPTEITIDYVVQPAFKAIPPPAPMTRSILVPITTPPVQVPRIVSAGLALSPYGHADDYSATDPRQRVLWLELAEPPLDPGDEYFVRILAYAPDPLLMDLSVRLPESIEPPLPIDPESMRRITPGQPRDDNGLRAMGQLETSPIARRHYLIPLPEDLADTSPELFGFFVYEVRLGHTAGRWSTAQGRFGPALRIAGVQHPAPPLECQAARGKTHILARAPFATPVHEGRNLRPRMPRTQMWALLYARVRQLDADAWRNLLIAETRLLPPEGNQPVEDARVLYGEGLFALTDVTDALRRLGLPPDAPLTVLATELFGDPPQDAPLGSRLGQARILRVSTLLAVPDAC